MRTMTLSEWRRIGVKLREKFKRQNLPLVNFDLVREDVAIWKYLKDYCCGRKARLAALEDGFRHWRLVYRGKKEVMKRI